MPLSQEDTGLPLAEILVLLGFFMIYIVEEVVHHGMDWYYGKYLSKVSYHLNVNRTLHNT